MDMWKDCHTCNKYKDGKCDKCNTYKLNMNIHELDYWIRKHKRHLKNYIIIVNKKYIKDFLLYSDISKVFYREDDTLKDEEYFLIVRALSL